MLRDKKVFSSHRILGHVRPWMSRRLTVALTIVGFAVVAGVPNTTAPGSEVPPAESLAPLGMKFSLAERISEEFFACARRNDKPRSIHILDAGGSTVHSARMDGQFADNIEVARLKAEAALYFRDSTRVWLRRAQHDPFLAQRLTQLGAFVSPTGLPIVIDGQLVGAVGVGGESGECAHEALTRVVGPQPPLLPLDE